MEEEHYKWLMRNHKDPEVVKKRVKEIERRCRELKQQRLHRFKAYIQRLKHERTVKDVKLEMVTLGWQHSVKEGEHKRVPLRYKLLANLVMETENEEDQQEIANNVDLLDELAVSYIPKFEIGKLPIEPQLLTLEDSLNDEDNMKKYALLTSEAKRVSERNNKPLNECLELLKKRKYKAVDWNMLYRNGLPTAYSLRMRR